MRGIILSDYRTMVSNCIFSAIELSGNIEYHIGKFKKLSGLSDIGSRPQSIGLLVIGLRRHHFVAASVLSTPTFCRCQHFVDLGILSQPIFCRRQYFCLCLGLRMIIIINDCVLCIS
jgi:hypothetical protein